MSDQVKLLEERSAPRILVTCMRLVIIVVAAVLGTTSGSPCNDDRCGSEGGDVDYDGICDDYDVCLAGDDDEDEDRDGIPDACDLCPEFPGEDADGDYICDGIDLCPGADDRIDVSGDGIPDCYTQCLLGFCPLPGEVYNGDFERGLDGWRWVLHGDFIQEPSVVQEVEDATGSVLILNPYEWDSCGPSEAIGLLTVPRSHREVAWALRLRYWLEIDGPPWWEYCTADYCPFEITVSRGDVHHSWAFLDPTAGWAMSKLCLPGEYMGRRVALRLETRAKENLYYSCYQYGFVMVDYIELTQDATDCLPPDPLDLTDSSDLRAG
jgi:hypothetical protein